MLEMLGARQKDLLGLLLKNKAGMTADELAEQLAITRNAVRQHLAALENERLLQKGDTRASGGRPQQLYVLTDKGYECFPRQYAWLAQLLVASLQELMGQDGLDQHLQALGEKVAQQLLQQHGNGLADPAQRVQVLSGLLQQLGYNARLPASAEAELVIEADNCVFHELAAKNPHICQFDLALLATFSGSTVEHQQCMAKHDHICRFRFGGKAGA